MSVSASSATSPSLSSYSPRRSGLPLLVLAGIAWGTGGVVGQIGRAAWRGRV